MTTNQGPTASPPDAPSPCTGEPLPTIPDVTLHHEIARGGMGVVYRGRQAFLDRDIAVKLLAPQLQGEQFAARFRREAKILAGIKHPNIVACHTAGTTVTGQSYLVMEFVDGPNLKTWIAEHGALPVAAALRLARQLASALGHAADLGVIHRDVKPENILLETPTSTALDLGFPYQPKLVDLGLARMTHETGDRGLTRPGAVMGTLGTMAPEQFDAPDAVDCRADIYGLGCVLYHMLTGVPAFASTKLTEVVAEKRRADGPDPCARRASIPAVVGRLVAAMLAADREDRPASHRQLAARLDELLASDALPAPGAWAGSSPPAPVAKAPARRQQSRLLQTAEIDFLAAGSALPVPTPEQNAFPAPSGEIGVNAVAAATPARAAVSAPTRAAPAPAAAPRAQRGRRMLVAGAATSVLLLVAVPSLQPWRSDVASPPQPSAPAPQTPASPVVDARPPGVTIRGLDGAARPHVPIELHAETTAAAGELRYSWSAQPEAAATLASPAAPSTALRLSGLPGDEFTIGLEVRADGGAPLQAERRIVLDYPPTDVFADFLDKSTDRLQRNRLHGEWTRRSDDGALVCTAPDTPCFRTRNIPGTVWRLAGQLLPERHNRRTFAQMAVCVRIGVARQLALVCERDGTAGESWTMSLQEVEREEGRVTFAFHPLAQPKAVMVIDRDGKVAGGAYTISRRGNELDIRFGFPGVHESAE
ncbi:MAG TPA: serine/threonine-protein kinase, partial [Planctomycetota bacterium]|nr:serine/threonine-protein kinase [Planctomycetota bacterium]